MWPAQGVKATRVEVSTGRASLRHRFLLSPASQCWSSVQPFRAPDRNADPSKPRVRQRYPCKLQTGEDSGIAAVRSELSSGYINLDNIAAERRETFGCSGTREACHNAARQAP